MLEIINAPVDPRAVHWFCEPFGNVGKTALCKWLVRNRYDDVMYFNNTCFTPRLCKWLRHSDMPKCILLDLSPGTENIDYAAIAHVKDGFVCNDDNFVNTFIDSPHVIVFATREPNIDALSVDRWHCYDIRELMEETDAYEEVSLEKVSKKCSV